MRCDLFGRFVSVHTEQWGGGDTGKAAGRRDTLYLLQETGAVIGISVRSDVFAHFSEFRPKLKDLAPVKLTVDVRAFANGGRAETTYVFVYGELATPAAPRTVAA